MEEKYWYGISYCCPEGSVSALGKFAIKVGLTVSGTPAAGLVSEGIVKLYKPLFGGMPVESTLIVTGDYFEFRPKKLTTYFIEGAAGFKIPGSEIVSVDKTFNYVIMHHIVVIKLRTTEVKFFINPYSVSVKKIMSDLRNLIR